MYVLKCRNSRDDKVFALEFGTIEEARESLAFHGKGLAAQVRKTMGKKKFRKFLRDKSKVKKTPDSYCITMPDGTVVQLKVFRKKEKEIVW